MFEAGFSIGKCSVGVESPCQDSRITEERERSESITVKESGQIIATSHDLTPNGGLVWEISLFQGNLCW